MIALDTNVLVRLVIGDDPAQAQRSAARIDDAETAFYVPLTVALELEWVLRGAYGLPRERVVSIFESLLSIRNLRFAEDQALSRALAMHRDGLDLADALHLQLSQNCEALLSFDVNLRKRAGAQALQPPVIEP
jgi:predicted nucleic-acid-binding protein